MTHQQQPSPELAACIEQCIQCHRICLAMATGHCLEKGGRHIEPEHLRTMLVCAEICRSAAYAMISGSRLHRQVCALCAEICEACSASCRAIDDMTECIDACERCKGSCQSMSRS